MGCDLKIAYRSNVALDFLQILFEPVFTRLLTRGDTKFLSVDVSKSLTRAGGEKG